MEETVRKQVEYMLPPELGSLLTISAIGYATFLFALLCLRSTNYFELRLAFSGGRWVWLDSLSRSVQQVQSLTRPHLERLLQAAHQEPNVEMKTIALQIELLDVELTPHEKKFTIKFSERENSARLKFYVAKVFNPSQLDSISEYMMKLVSSCNKFTPEDVTLSELGIPNGSIIETDNTQCSGPRNERTLEIAMLDSVQVTPDDVSKWFGVSYFSTNIVHQKMAKDSTRYILLCTEPGNIHSAHQVFVLQHDTTATATLGKLKLELEWAIPQGEEALYRVREIYGGSEEEGSIGESGSDCVICFENENNLILLPCRHKSVCSVCYVHIDKCPSCRSQIDGYVVVEN